MALFRLSSACAFKDLRHLIHSQVLRPTDLDHRIARARVIQRNADKTRNILHRHKIDWIVTTPKDDGLALLPYRLADQLSPEFHIRARAEDSEAQAAGLQILLCTVFDAKELQWRIGTCALNGDKNEALHARSFRCIDQVPIAHVINRLGVVVTLSVEGMRGSQHLLHSLAGTRKRGAISEVAAHNFYPLLLQVREAARVSGHDTKRFALREQVLNDNAAETATGPNDQYHILILSL